MKLILMRHAEAEALYQHDHDSERALTEQGNVQAVQVANWLRQQLAGETSLQLFASPYRRAQQTALHIAHALKTPLLTLAGITPNENVQQALTALETAATAQAVVVVTHMPLIAALSHWLESGLLSSVGQGFTLAEAHMLELAFPAPGMATRLRQFAPVALA